MHDGVGEVGDLAEAARNDLRSDEGSGFSGEGHAQSSDMKKAAVVVHVRGLSVGLLSSDRVSLGREPPAPA
jgi:hypothetical protein